jgi:hypothetical protein
LVRVDLDADQLLQSLAGGGNQSRFQPAAGDLQADAPEEEMKRKDPAILPATLIANPENTMRARHWMLAVAVLSLVACSKEQSATAGAPAAAAGQATRAPAGTFLAYEHRVGIRLAGRDIPARVAAVQASCFAQAFGDCAVLNVSQHGGEYPGGSVTVRIAPKGVEPLIAQAGKGGEIGSRDLKAEDLAEAVRDTALQRDRLEKEHARLLQFEGRPNLSVADMLALSKQLADIEAALDATQREAAQQRHRIDTNLLTLEFQPTGTEAGRSEIGQALSDSGRILAASTAGLIRVVAFLVPLLLVLGAGFAAWRWRARRLGAKRGH